MHSPTGLDQQAEQQARRDDAYYYTSFTTKPTPTAGGGLQDNLNARDATALYNYLRGAARGITVCSVGVPNDFRLV